MTSLLHLLCGVKTPLHVARDILEEKEDREEAARRQWSGARAMVAMETRQRWREESASASDGSDYGGDTDCNLTSLRNSGRTRSSSSGTRTSGRTSGSDSGRSSGSNGSDSGIDSSSSATNSCRSSGSSGSDSGSDSGRSSGSDGSSGGSSRNSGGGGDFRPSPSLCVPGRTPAGGHAPSSRHRLGVMSSPRLMRRLGRGNSLRRLKVLVLGQSAVGKTALTVRFITRRFIGEYDPTLERKYSFNTEVESIPVTFEIFDTAGQTEDSLHLQENIRWADAYVLMYSVTDRCSFNECTRLKFLINHNRRSHRACTCTSGGGSAGTSGTSGNNACTLPVVMVGNKNDLEGDRMVSFHEGQKMAGDLGCSKFHEISVRESYPEVKRLFDDVYFLYRNGGRKSASSSSTGCTDRKTPGRIALCRADAIGGMGMSMEERTSGSDSDIAMTTAVKQRKQLLPRRLIRRVFKQDSICESVKEDTLHPNVT